MPLLSDSYEPQTQKSLFHQDIVHHIRKWMKLMEGYAEVNKSVAQILFLQGPIGCGKTKSVEIFHFDLYRLKNAQELENIGFFDAMKNGICLIEWPEIAKNFLPKNYVEIEILNKNQVEEKAGKNPEIENEDKVLK